QMFAVHNSYPITKIERMKHTTPTISAMPLQDFAICLSNPTLSSHPTGPPLDILHTKLSKDQCSKGGLKSCYLSYTFQPTRMTQEVSACSYSTDIPINVHDITDNNDDEYSGTDQPMLTILTAGNLPAPADKPAKTSRSSLTTFLSRRFKK
ncbi:hypothetical protein SARC_11439, partial [Sphaeroforma arctica JP610]